MTAESLGDAVLPVALAAFLLGCSSVGAESQVPTSRCDASDKLGLPLTIQSLVPAAAACPAELDEDAVRELAAERPVGWAAVEGEGLSETTGGLSGGVVLARTLQELESYAALPEPLIIAVCGVIGGGMDEVEVEAQKTLIGVGDRPTLRGSLDIEDTQDIIVKNLYIEVSDPDLATGPNPDGITVRRAHHVWIDHVDISDGADGNLDVTNESNHVTISYSRFWYRDPDRSHRFSNLIGSGDNRPEDSGLLKVTLHHNWWGDNVTERMPRTRYGDIHVFNNLYTSRNDNYCIRSGEEARVLVEGNYFLGVSDPLDLYGGELLERDNVYDDAPGTKSGVGNAFEPPYAYELEPACAVPKSVAENAGPR